MLPLIELIQAYPGRVHLDPHCHNYTISHIASDSREVKKDSLFIALHGSHTDGRRYIEDALIKGAKAIVVQEETDVPAMPVHVALIRVDSPRLAVAKMAARFYPKQPQHIVAVTGTDGKTSTVHFVREGWERLGFKAASIGTLGIIGEQGKLVAPGSHTTPDPIQLHRLLMELADMNYTHVAIEASSHGLDQRRLDGVQLEAAAFTNFTRDHLDYHKTSEAYFAAKLRLFKDVLKEQGTAVVNIEDAHVEPIVRTIAKRGCQIIEYGEAARHLTIGSLLPKSDGQQAELQIMGEPYTLHTKLVGAFQVYNMMAAAGLMMATGSPWPEVAEILPHLPGVPGRLQRVEHSEMGSQIFVDYAHTPTALANVLETLRPYTHGRLMVVFGCGGDRDRGKRPEMGQIACSLADIAIVTDDNPRTEDPASIRREIMSTCKGGIEIADRRKAIQEAVKRLQPGDVLLVAGKGHEAVQIIGTEQLPFDDAVVIRESMAA